MNPQHVRSLHDLTPGEINAVVKQAHQLRENLQQGIPPEAFFRGLVGALIFEKRSNRTKASFSAGLQRYGGGATFFAGNEILTNDDGKEREPMPDTVRCLERSHRFIIARVMAHATITRMAEAAKQSSVINALCDRYHPCQGLATTAIIDRLFPGDPNDVTVAYFGDGNNVATDLAIACAKRGHHFRHAGPDDAKYKIPQQDWDQALEYAEDTGASLTWTPDPREAAQNAKLFYTDTHTSMGQEQEAEERREALGGFIVDEELIRLGQPDARFSHCLPAHRGEEVATSVIDGPQSVVFDEAEYREHVQVALMRLLLEQIGE